MEIHDVHAHRSKDNLKREYQLAWKIAAVAADPVEVDAEATDMIINRIIDNASVAIASLNRGPIKSARAMAIAHPRKGGASLFGLPADHTVCAEWAAWANGTAVRELDFHDTFLAADYSHPGDNIPPVLAVAQQCGKSGRDFVRGIATGYEIQVNLVKSICLHEHKIDHIAHIGPSASAAVGTLLGLPTEVIYQSVQQGLHTTVTTRQSRKGEISSWKAFAPAYAGKLAIEAVDRCMRGEGAPSPIYEGEDSVIAYILNGRTARDKGESPYEPSYRVPLPGAGEAKRAILETYTKEHSAEYQSQALIDLAFRMGKSVEERGGFDKVKSIVLHTSHHTHYVIGTGSGDPQKMDPNSSRETLDHSIMYIFAVALQDGEWHHVRSYAPERAKREDTVRLWHKISTVEDPEWTRRYHSPDPNEKAFGARVVVTMEDGTTIEDELGIANAHPFGARPFGRAEYIRKFKTLTEEILDPAESERFLDLVQKLPDLSAEDVKRLNPVAPPGYLQENDAQGDILTLMEIPGNAAANKTLKRWHEIIANSDIEGLPSIVHPDVIFRSPMVYKPYHGQDALVLALSTVITVFEDFTYHRQFTSEDGNSVTLEFSATVNGKELKGADFIKFDAEGLIVEFEVMVRPASGLMALGEEMGKRVGEKLATFK